MVITLNIETTARSGTDTLIATSDNFESFTKDIIINNRQITIAESVDNPSLIQGQPLNFNVNNFKNDALPITWTSNTSNIVISPNNDGLNVTLYL